MAARFLPLFASALCTSVSAQVAILTVDASGGGQFTTIQTAVQAANPSDVLDVFPGVYQGIRTTKGLHIDGGSGGLAVSVLSPIHISGIPTQE